MGYISAFFALRTVDIASASAPSKNDRRQTLLETAGIDPDAQTEPAQMIPDTAYFGLLEHIAGNYEGGRSIAVRTGASMRCDDYGAFGLAFKSAVDLWGSFQRVERYGKVVTNVANYIVEPGNGSAFMALRPDPGTRLGLKMTNELAVAAATAISREVCRQEFAPVEVCFSHAEPDDLSAHAAHFRCPVQYGADRDGLEIADELLYSGNQLGDERISEFFDTHLDKELARRTDDDQFEARVRAQITRALSEGVPKISDISMRLGMSNRTLQRRLAEEGYVYQDLVDAARRDLAVQLLRRTEFALAEIAFLTGYSEQSTFTRAFKRWHGQTPTSFRRANSTT